MLAAIVGGINGGKVCSLVETAGAEIDTGYARPHRQESRFVRDNITVNSNAATVVTLAAFYCGILSESGET